jgi:ABC-type sugar transport system substrate-binding protein
VLLNRTVDYLDRLHQAAPQLPVATFGTDQIEAGRIQGRQARALVGPAGGFVLYVRGPRDNDAAQGRLVGARQELAAVDVEVIESDWTEITGEAVVGRWLRQARRRPVAIVCQNDLIALGAVRALRDTFGAADARRIPVTGLDGLAEGGQAQVRAGQLAATVVMPSNTGPAIEWLHDALTSGRERFTQRLLRPTGLVGRRGTEIAPSMPATLRRASSL